MSNSERLFVIEIATKLIRGTINETPKLSLEEKRTKLKSSAESMLSEYSNNKFENPGSSAPFRPIS